MDGVRSYNEERVIIQPVAVVTVVGRDIVSAFKHRWFYVDKWAFSSTHHTFVIPNVASYAFY